MLLRDYFYLSTAEWFFTNGWITICKTDIAVDNLTINNITGDYYYWRLIVRIDWTIVVDLKSARIVWIILYKRVKLVNVLGINSHRNGDDGGDCLRTNDLIARDVRVRGYDSTTWTTNTNTVEISTEETVFTERVIEKRYYVVCFLDSGFLENFFFRFRIHQGVNWKIVLIKVKLLLKVSFVENIVWVFNVL